MFNHSVFFSVLFASLLAGCASEPKPLTDRELRQQLGAIYDNRLPQTETFKSVSLRSNGAKIINLNIFKQQILEVKKASPRLAQRYQELYNKVEHWLNHGAKLEELNQFGIDPHQMKGIEGFQNVLMTSYYTPIQEARKNPVGKFIHPIYGKPQNLRLSRRAIQQGALENAGVTLAYTQSMMNNFLLSVQGSGYLDFGDGHLKYIGYAGQNGYPYVSIGKHLVKTEEIPKTKISLKAIREWAERYPDKVPELLAKNPSYIYFKHIPDGRVKGAANVPLLAMASLAADKKLVPLGSVLLIEVAELDKEGQWTGKHQLYLMLALDVGGAIKGQHFDLYRGIGKEAEIAAGFAKHYGRAWIFH